MTVTIGPDRLIRGATNVLELQRLRDQTSATPSYPADASVKATVIDATGAPVTGAIDIVCNVVDAGATYPVYRGIVNAAVALTSPSHTVKFTVTRGGSTGIFLLAPQTLDGIP